MKEKILYQNKELLNKSGFHGVAAVSADFVLNPRSEYRTAQTFPEIEGSLQISDCARVISLDLNIYNKSDYENAIHKLSALQSVIIDAYNKLVENQADYDAAYDKAKKKEDKKAKKKKAAKKENSIKGGVSVGPTLDA